MAHWRAIHKGICTSARLVTLEEWEQLLFVQLVVQGDQHGRLAGDALSVRLKCCPASVRSQDEIEAALLRMTASDRHLVELYETDGVRVCQVLEWDDMQPSSYLKGRGPSAFPEKRSDSQLLGSHEIPQNPTLEEKRREENIREDRSATQPLSSSKRRRRNADVPVEAMLNLYCEHLGAKGNPQPTTVTDKMKAAATARWKSRVQVGQYRSDSLEFWQRYFEYASTCPHLVGENGWRASFRWLLERSGFERVINREYEATPKDDSVYEHNAAAAREAMEILDGREGG